MAGVVVMKVALRVLCVFVDVGCLFFLLLLFSFVNSVVVVRSGS